MKNMRIAMKFVVSFGIVIVLLLAQGAIAYWSSSEVDEHVSELVDVHVPSLEGLLGTVDNMRRVIAIQRTFLYPSLSPERVAALQNELGAARAAYVKGMELYASLPKTPEEARAWQELQELLVQGRALNDKIVVLEEAYRSSRSQEHYEQMAELMLGEFFELDNKIFNKTEKIVAHTIAASRESGLDSEKHSKIGKQAILVASLLVLVIVIPVAFLLSRSIIVPLRRGKAMAEAFAKGDLSGRLRLERRDEIGALGAALDGMADVVARLVRDIAAMADSVSQGALRRHLDTTGLENEYGLLVKNFNAMLAGVLAVLDALPTPVMIRDANRSVLFLNRAGGFGRIDPAEVEGNNCGAYFCTEDCHNGQCACEKALASGRMEKGVTVARPHGDMEVEIEYSAVPLGRGIVMEHVVDLTQLKIAQRELLQRAVDQLEGVVENVTSAVAQLSAQVGQSRQGAQEQAERIGETATSMEEMNSTVLEVAKNASNVAATSEKARDKAEQGAGVVAQAIAGIGEVQKLSLRLKEDMTALGRQVAGVGDVMDVISDIADQTNLLALNAAIEAARAGDAGRGFAVVADEVRKLAEKTMAATKQVGETIRGIQSGTQRNVAHVDLAGDKIEQASTLADKSGQSLREIVALVEMTSDQVRSIATASEQQYVTSEEINRSVTAVNRISTATADAMWESEQAVANLSQQAQGLRDLIEEMQAEDGGARSLESGLIPVLRSPVLRLPRQPLAA